MHWFNEILDIKLCSIGQGVLEKIQYLVGQFEYIFVTNYLN